MTDADASLKQSIREKAKHDLDAWYEQRSAAIEKQKAKNRVTDSNELDENNTSGIEAVKYVTLCLNLYCSLLVAGNASLT